MALNSAALRPAARLASTKGAGSKQSRCSSSSLPRAVSWVTKWLSYRSAARAISCKEKYSSSSCAWAGSSGFCSSQSCNGVCTARRAAGKAAGSCCKNTVPSRAYSGSGKAKSGAVSAGSRLTCVGSVSPAGSAPVRGAACAQALRAARKTLSALVSAVFRLLLPLPSARFASVRLLLAN